MTTIGFDSNQMTTNQKLRQLGLPAGSLGEQWRKVTERSSECLRHPFTREYISVCARSAWRALWENWKDSGEWIRTFVVITTDANELVAQIHNRMPLILHPKEAE